jgi:hypothetical protein
MAGNSKAKKKGRPPKYSDSLGQVILELIKEGESIRNISRRKDMPSRPTIYSWINDLDHPFSSQYARAREIGYLKMAEELLDIADDGANDFYDKELDSGKTIQVVDHEHIQRSRLRVDTRKWILSKMLPKIYGDKVTAQVSGPEGGPVEVKDVTPVSVRQEARVILALLREAQENNDEEHADAEQA